MNSFTYDELQKLMNDFLTLSYIEPGDIPSIELYMDQITTFMDSKLGTNKRHEEDKIMTKTMINNYSKANLLPPSECKRYSKDHLILLIYIYYLKNFLSINDIQQLLTPMTQQYFGTGHEVKMDEIYHDIFTLEQQYGVKVRESIQDVYDIAQNEFGERDDYLKTFAMISMLSYDIYAKKQLIERLIDHLQDDTAASPGSKSNKQTKKQKEKAAKTQSKTERKNNREK